MTKSDIKEQENQIKNNVMAVKGKPKFSLAIQSDTYKNLINNTLGDKNRATRFIANITTVVSNNPQLQECDSGSILSAGLLAESLNLSLSPQLGFCYLVPFNDSKRGGKVAQFQMGYKGYLQLAMRSGTYADIDVIEVKEGEFLGRDENTGKYKFKFIANDDERENKETVGYLAYFEYLNGFRKQLYWSKEKVTKHAIQYSQGYRADKQRGTSYTFWSKNFDDMAFKTMIRQLISKWGVMSIELQTAYANDMAMIKEDGTVEYVDNEETPEKAEQSEPEPKRVNLEEI